MFADGEEKRGGLGLEQFWSYSSHKALLLRGTGAVLQEAGVGCGSSACEQLCAGAPRHAAVIVHAGLFKATTRQSTKRFQLLSNFLANDQPDSAEVIQKIYSYS